MPLAPLGPNRTRLLPDSPEFARIPAERMVAAEPEAEARMAARVTSVARIPYLPSKRTTPHRPGKSMISPGTSLTSIVAWFDQ
jgi:hypothetical protein